MKEMLYAVGCLKSNEDMLLLYAEDMLLLYAENLCSSSMLKKSGDSTGFEPMTSAMPVQCSN